MCGIAGFVLDSLSEPTHEVTSHWWMSARLAELEQMQDLQRAVGVLPDFVASLVDQFSQLMSSRTCYELSRSPECRQTARELSAHMSEAASALAKQGLSGNGAMEAVAESLEDMSWQIGEELIGLTERIELLLKGVPNSSGYGVFRVAYAVESVLTSIERLEVRGRDSAGIVISFTIPSHLAATVAGDLKGEEDAVGSARAFYASINDESCAVSAVYKTASLVGRLGDNCNKLRELITGDSVLWALLPYADKSTILGHTRWASRGEISIANCHPQTDRLIDDRAGEGTKGWFSVLNGDIDNYDEMRRMWSAAGAACRQALPLTQR